MMPRLAIYVPVLLWLILGVLISTAYSATKKHKDISVLLKDEQKELKALKAQVRRLLSLHLGKNT